MPLLIFEKDIMEENMFPQTTLTGMCCIIKIIKEVLGYE